MILKTSASRKITACLLLITLLNNLIYPSVSYALTSGPTQPEATSFEPVDTTDMVNLQTGDLTYNVPLLEVPGPEGGYPLSLSYHAGIQPNEDASWVGLGWTLNPGAITRNVNGYPDDWSDVQNSNRTYWSGGSISTYKVGVSVGLANSPATVGVGLSFSQDTYRGFGVGMDLTVGSQFGIGGNTSIGASATIGVSPYGDPYASASVSLGVDFDGKDGGLNGSVGFSVSTNFQSVTAGFGGGVGWSGKGADKGDNHFGGSLLGASMATGGSKPSLSIGGLSASVSSGTVAKIQTKTSGFGLDIPVWYGVNVSLGYSKTRYWTDETNAVRVWGSDGGGGVAATDRAYDVYSLLEDPGQKNIIDFADPKEVQGGTYPDFDQYSVNAQGLAGNMRPYQFQKQLIGQNRNDAGGNSLIRYYVSQTSGNATADFRFVNDFSNSYTQNYDSYSTTTNPETDNPPFDAAPQHGVGAANGSSALAGSKHVAIGSQYVTGINVVLASNALGYNSSAPMGKGLSGYDITNESGVTYHFRLPAYSYGEEAYQEKIGERGQTFTRQTKAEGYAYTWYLTTITGPDFVDRNGDGKAGDGDWGYWVNFEYGKESNDYIWRNPSEGYQRDEDNQWQNCSMGKKEIYYLNAIRTRSHVALFEKSVRKDGKGASSSIFGKNNSKEYTNDGIFDGTSDQSMQLSKIYLLNASDGTSVTPSSSPATITNVLASNVLDNNDVDATGRGILESKAIRIIDFAYDYSLSKGTTNSFDIATPTVKDGRLTLKSVSTRGKGGAGIMPPTKFEYELDATDMVSQAGVSMTATTFTTTNAGFQIGDLVQTSTGIFCGVISNKQPSSGSNYIYTLTNSLYTGSGTVTVSTTKNPPYNKDNYDMWGSYKSDINMTSASSNENQARTTNPVSGVGADVWSLRKIKSGLGNDIIISYESDKFSKTSIKSNYPYILKSVVVENTTATQITSIKFKIDNYSYQTISVGNILTVLLETMYEPLQGSDNFIVWNQVSITSIDGDGTFHAAMVNPIPLYSINNNNPFIAIGRGNMSATDIPEICGGGIRVSSVKIRSSSGFAVRTSYNYNDILSPSVSSGVTSYTPTILDAYDRLLVDQPAGDAENKAYTTKLYQNLMATYSIARELPPPGVMYEYVTVTKEVKNPDEILSRSLDGSTQYQFEVYRDNMVSRQPISVTSPIVNSTYIKNLAIKKFTASIGNVKRITQYDSKGKKLSETINNYLHDGLENLSATDFMTQYKARLAQFAKQGFFQERYNEVKYVKDEDQSSNTGYKATLSAREEYPCIATGQTVINYVNGTRTTSENLAYDFYSGALTKTVETDAYGNRMMTETVPAYTKYTDASYPNKSMGLKLNNELNSNMLTQVAETYMWKVDASNSHLGLISATSNTWKTGTTTVDPGGVAISTTGVNEKWRPQATYTWMPVTKTSDGLTATGSFVDFNFATPSSSDANWKKTSEITLYDVYSHALEGTDINNNSAATRMGYNSTKVVVSGGPAKYNEIAFSGAEDALVSSKFGGGPGQGTGAVVSKTTDAAPTHTGAKSILCTPGQTAFTYSPAVASLSASKDYFVSIWAKAASGTALPNAQIGYAKDGLAATFINLTAANAKQSGTSGWYLLTGKVPFGSFSGGTTLNVYVKNSGASGNVYFDDFRFSPQSASTTAYVYDPFSGELTYVLGNNNLYTRFEYDGAGRLLRTYAEKLSTGEFKVSEYQYNFGQAQYKSAAISQPYTRNNCAVNYSGTSVPVYVAEGAFVSSNSQLEADQQAQAYAQSLANQQGNCALSTTSLSLINAAGASNYQARFVSTQSSDTYPFNFPPTGTTNNLSLSTGSYNLYVYAIGGSGSSYKFTWSDGINSGTSTGTSATFNNVNVNAPISVTIQLP